MDLTFVLPTDSSSPEDLNVKNHIIIAFKVCSFYSMRSLEPRQCSKKRLKPEACLAFEHCRLKIPDLKGVIHGLLVYYSV